jgi:transposase
LVRARSRAKNEIYATLQRRLVAKPACSDLFGVAGRAWLAQVELPVEERESVDAGLRQIAFLDGEIAAVERLIAQQAVSWPEIRRLMTVPGVKLISAAAFMAAVGHPNRFSTSRKLVAYLGLDPRVWQSGEGAARGGRISKRGCGHARWALVEAGVERGHPARAVARLLSAHPGPARARHGDRGQRPQAGRAVLVHADPGRGLRPPAPLAD